jgi:hypothetical protein
MTAVPFDGQSLMLFPSDFKSNPFVLLWIIVKIPVRLGFTESRFSYSFLGGPLL